MAATVRATNVVALNRLVDELAERAGRLGVKTHRMATLDEVAALAEALGTDGGPAAFAPAPGEPWRVVLAPTLDEAQPALRQHLATREIALGVIDLAAPRASFAGVSVGISQASYGIAETGTLVVADGLADRLVRMLSPKHIAVLDIANMLPSLDEAGNRLAMLIAGGGEAPGRYITFITGPSRTADIEMSLTVGAHGPAELHIAIIGAGQA